MSQALCLGSIPMALATTPLDWLIVAPLSVMASAALYGALMKLVVARRSARAR